MATKKRKSDTRLDEVDRTLYSSFCGAASTISQLYTQTQHQQKIAFLEGERHFAERICQRLKDQQRSLIPIEDVYEIIQNVFENSGGDELMSPSNQSQQISSYAMQQSQSLCSVDQAVSDAIEHHGLGHTSRSAPLDLSKAHAFSGALSSPSQRCASPFLSMQAGHPFISSDSTATLARCGGTAVEECAQHTKDLDYFIGRYNGNSMSTSVGSPVYAYDPRFFQRRPTHSADDIDTSMDMHADGNVDTPY